MGTCRDSSQENEPPCVGKIRTELDAQRFRADVSAADGSDHHDDGTAAESSRVGGPGDAGGAARVEQSWAM